MIFSMRQPVPALEMSAGQREVLESLARSQSGAHREVVRAKALLMAADGAANTAIAASLSVSPASVKSWRERFTEEGLAKLGQVRKGRGRKPSIPQSKIDEIIDLTQNYRPQGETHWSCRTMAAAAGVSKSTVQLVWNARGLKPHRVQTFKLSNDPRFEEKLVDVVGLYMNPPEKAIVLCADEKSSVQALDREDRHHGDERQRLARDALAGLGRGERIDDALHHALRPNSPAGRISSTIAMMTKITVFDASGQNTLVRPSMMPRPKPVRIAPMIEPMPPITTTAKTTMIRSEPICGDTL